LRELEEEVKRYVYGLYSISQSTNVHPRLEDEKAAWESLSKASILMPPPPPPSTHTPRPTISDIDASLLDPSQASILSALVQTQHQPSPSSNSFSYTTPAALQSHLSTLSVSLEPNIDVLADGLHKIDQYRNTAERVADRILGTAAQRLQERERVGREKAGSEGIGVGDVLRGLAGVLNE
jgi:kinetochore protein Mis13/DSN1